MWAAGSGWEARAAATVLAAAAFVGSEHVQVPFWSQNDSVSQELKEKPKAKKNIQGQTVVVSILKMKSEPVTAICQGA